MPLFTLIDALRQHVAATVPGAPPVGSALPGRRQRSPLTVSLEDVVPSVRGLGAFPSPPLTGALRVDTTVDLADPVLTWGGRRRCFPDRRTLQLPHGAVVRAAATTRRPTAPPICWSGSARRRSRRCTRRRPRPRCSSTSHPARSRFANPLPATGTLELGYFVGVWEVRVERFKATLNLDVAARRRRARDALRGRRGRAAAGPGRRRAAGSAASSRARSRRRRRSRPSPAPRARSASSTRVEFESIENVIPSSGGPIREVDVDSVFDPIVIAVTESFEVE